MVPNVYQIVYKLELFTLMYCLQKVVAKPFISMALIKTVNLTIPYLGEASNK